MKKDVTSKIKIKCLYCVKEFLGYKNRKVYCDIKCRNKHYEKRFCGINSPQWKGDKASYSAIHKYISSEYGKPKLCINCKTKGKRMNWANISRKYSRDISDWLELCASCHKWLDTRSEAKRLQIIKQLLNGEEIEWQTSQTT